MKIIITLEDVQSEDNNASVNIKATFDPPLGPVDGHETPAEIAAAIMFSAVLTDENLRG